VGGEGDLGHPTGAFHLADPVAGVSVRSCAINVIARSEATKQSTGYAVLWIASLRSQ